MTIKLIGHSGTGDDNAGGTVNYFYLHKFTAEVTGSLSEIRIKADTGGSCKVALYADNAGEPGVRLAKKDASTTVATGWNTIALEASAFVTINTDYWLAIAVGTANLLRRVIAGPNQRRYRAETYSSFVFPDPAGSGFTTGTTYTALIQGYGTVTINISPVGVAQPVAYGTPKLTLVLKPAGLAQEVAIGVPRIGEPFFLVVRKVLITHPALKQVDVIKAGQTTMSYQNLSNLDESRIENAFEIPVDAPATIKVTALSGEEWTFNIPA
jgi:hypothetical protein